MEELEKLYTHLGNITWYAYAIGYLYAIFCNPLLSWVVVRMHEKIKPDLPLKDHKWQYLAIGVTEKILYVTAFLLQHGEFIAFWVVLKVAVPYLRWTGKDDQETKEDEKKKKNEEDEKQQMEKAEEGRSLFMNTVIGNGLSILYAGVGYGMIEWISRGTWPAGWLIPLLLIVYTVFLGEYVKRWKPRLIKKAKCQ